MSLQYRAPLPYPVVRTCLLITLLTVALVYRTNAALLVTAIAVLAVVLAAAATRSLRRASHRIDTILAEEPAPQPSTELRKSA